MKYKQKGVVKKENKIYKVDKTTLTTEMFIQILRAIYR